MGTTPDNRGESYYFHASVPEHKADLDDQAKNPQKPREGSGEKVVPMQQVIFDRRNIDLFNQALQDPNHKHRREAEKALWGFTRAVEKPDGISINSAAQEFNVPESFSGAGQNNAVLFQ
jgi:hypothetical protein